MFIYLFFFPTKRSSAFEYYDILRRFEGYFLYPSTAKDPPPDDAPRRGVGKRGIAGGPGP